MKGSLQEVHEYIADDSLSRNAASKKKYAKLLLGLTCDVKTCDFVSGFSGKQISRRVLMMTKSRSSNYYKLLFLLILPVAAIILFSFSYFDDNGSGNPSNSNSELQSEVYSSEKIGQISWVGNSVYSDARLTEALGLKRGDDYSKEDFENHMVMDEDGIYALYLDNGYLFFQADLSENITDDGYLDLTIKVFEGSRTKIGKVFITGNKNVPTEDILGVIKLKSGEWFSRVKILQSVRAISDMDKFDSEKIMPIPKPKKGQNNEWNLVDIEFEVTEK